MMNNDAHHGEAEAAEPAAPTLAITPTAPQDEVHGAAEVSDAGESEVSAAASLLTLAQRLHDEHVAEGQETRERLISEGQSHHDHVVSKATARHDELPATGQAKHDALVAEAEALIVAAISEHEQTITEARERSTRMVAEAQSERAGCSTDSAEPAGRRPGGPPQSAISRGPRPHRSHTDPEQAAPRRAEPAPAPHHRVA